MPLWPETAQVLRAWFRELGDTVGGAAFPSARGRALSRDGVGYLLRQAIVIASAACPSLATKKVSPHVLRHSTAMHLFQAGVDMAVAALWLGHESLETTHVYVEAAWRPRSGRSTSWPNTGHACPLPGRRQAAGLSRQPLIMPSGPE